MGGEEKEKRNCGESGGGEEAEIASVDIQLCRVVDDEFSISVVDGPGNMLQSSFQVTDRHARPHAAHGLFARFVDRYNDLLMI